MNRRRAPGDKRAEPLERGASAIAAFFRALFGRKDGDFKALLMSDLGIER